MAHRTGQNRQQFGLFATVSTHRIRHGRHVERSLDEAATEANRLRVLNRHDNYKRRQAIVEHPFGTIKRSWGFYYTLLKGKEKVSGEYSLVFLAYNPAPRRDNTGHGRPPEAGKSPVFRSF